MPINARVLVISVLALSVAEPAWAYIGPGAGLSLAGAFLALLMAVVAALGFLVLWPMRRLVRRIKSGRVATPVQAVNERRRPSGSDATHRR